MFRHRFQLWGCGLGKIGLERFQRFLKRAAQRAYGRRRLAFHLGSFGRVFEQRPQRSRHFVRSPNEPKPFVALQNRISFGEVECVRPAQNSGAELDRLDRVLPAVMNQRSADERKRGERIEKAKLADGVREIDVGVLAYRLVMQTAAPRPAAARKEAPRWLRPDPDAGAR